MVEPRVKAPPALRPWGRLPGPPRHTAGCRRRTGRCGGRPAWRTARSSACPAFPGEGAPTPTPAPSSAVKSRKQETVVKHVKALFFFFFLKTLPAPLFSRGGEDCSMAAPDPPFLGLLLKTLPLSSLLPFLWVRNKGPGQTYTLNCAQCSVSCSVVSDSLRPHRL